jgi:ribosomal protein S27E
MIKYFKDSSKPKKVTKERTQIKEKKSVSQKTPKTHEIEKKLAETESWLGEEAQKLKESETEKSTSLDEVESKPEESLPIQEEPPEEKREEQPTPFKDELPKEPEEPVTSEEEPVEEETQPSASLEKALSSAIEKKQIEVNEQPPEVIEKQAEEEKPAIKKLSVKCPQCNHVFIVEKKIGELTKIKCPECGKDGVIK